MAEPDPNHLHRVLVALDSVADFIGHESNARSVTESHREPVMSKVVYISKSSIEPKRGPLRIAHLPGEPQPECSYTQRA